MRTVPVQLVKAVCGAGGSDHCHRGDHVWAERQVVPGVKVLEAQCEELSLLNDHILTGEQGLTVYLQGQVDGLGRVVRQRGRDVEGEDTWDVGDVHC